MAMKLYNEENIQNIANAIRNKNKTENTYKVSEMATAINDIQADINNQDKTITENGTYTADEGYTGLGEVIVNVEGGTPPKKYTGHADVEGLRAIGWTDEEIQNFQDNCIFWNEEDDDIYKLTDDEKNDIAMEAVNTRYLPKSKTNISLTNYNAMIGVPKITLDYSNNPKNLTGCYSLKVIPEINGSSNVAGVGAFQNCFGLREIKKMDIVLTNTSANSMFQYCYNLEKVPTFDTNRVTSMSNMFQGCHSMINAPDLDTSNVTNMNYMFSNCYSLMNVPLYDTQKLTSMNYMFQMCYSLQKIPNFNTLNVTTMTYAFNNCYSLRELPPLNTSKVTNFSHMFDQCHSIEKIPKLNAEKVVTLAPDPFLACYHLKDFGGLENIGMAYLTSRASAYSAYTFDMQYQNRLTHDSLMNIINNLYDIATKGVKAQKLILGATNLAKLSEEEIAIATAKGWTVS